MMPGEKTMNDTELDEMLNGWAVPPVRAAWRERVRAGFWAVRRPQRRGLFAGALLAAAMSLLVITQAFPQRLGLRALPAGVPWTVDSEFLRYAEDGSASIEMYGTSYQANGAEVVLSRSIPGNPFKTSLGQTLDVAIPAWSRFITPFVVDSVQLEKREKMKWTRDSGVAFVSGCGAPACLTMDYRGFRKTPAAATAGGSCLNGAIASGETILQHPTETFRHRWTDHGRITLWMAPDLACFVLKMTKEEQRPDGTFHVILARQAVRVRVRPVP